MSPPAGRDPRLRRAPLLVLVFLGCFAATAALVRTAIPMPSHYDLDDKLRYFAEHKDEFDLVFIGSSATFRNVAPEIVDAGLAEEGLELRSFNFGIVGFRSFETDFMIRWVLDQDPARLRYMVIEPPPFDPPFDYEAIQGQKSELAVHSHTPEETALILRSVWLADLKLGVKYRETIRHLKLCAMNLLNLGRAPAVVRQRLARDPDWTPPAWLAEARGFQPVEDRPGFVEPDPNPLGTPAHYRETALAIDAANRGAADLSRYNFAALRRQIRVLRDHGVEPIYCLSPVLFVMPEALALYEQGELPNALVFHLPKDHPDLFRYEERIDATHYRRAGAERFSRFLAPRLAEAIRKSAR